MYHSHSRACLQWWRMAKTRGMTSNDAHIEKNKMMMNICRKTMRDGKHISGNDMRWKTHVKEQWNHVEGQ